MSAELDKVIFAIICGQPVDSLPAELVKEAKDRIALAADVDRRHELGKAIQRLEAVFAASLNEDAKTALATQKELNRLLRLYEAQAPKQDTAGSESQQELARVADYLLPLNLAPADYPLSGHARIAADMIRMQTPPTIAT